MLHITVVLVVFRLALHSISSFVFLEIFFIVGFIVCLFWMLCEANLSFGKVLYKHNNYYYYYYYSVIAARLISEFDLFEVTQYTQHGAKCMPNWWVIV